MAIESQTGHLRFISFPACSLINIIEPEVNYKALFATFFLTYDSLKFSRAGTFIGACPLSWSF